MEETIIKFISQVGVPAGIAVFILVRLESALKGVETSLNRNAKVLAVMLAKLDCDAELKELLEGEANVSKTVKCNKIYCNSSYCKQRNCFGK